MLTFKEWIVMFVGVDLPIGDIATEIELDNEFPNSKNYEVNHEFVESNYSESFIRVFEYSFKMFYESTQKKF